MNKDSNQKQDIDIPIESIHIKGILTIPKQAIGIVLFAHGSGSGRFSPRNQFVAQKLNEAKIATLLMDLLTPQEENIDIHTRELRFNIPLLAKRLSGTSDWVNSDQKTKHLKIGYYGASTGAAAALVSAAEKGSQIKAVVSRGGRPDLAGIALEKVQSPTLLIVGGNDFGVIELNQEALRLIKSEKKLVIIPGATHLFEEPGSLEEVSDISQKWFEDHFKT